MEHSQSVDKSSNNSSIQNAAMETPAPSPSQGGSPGRDTKSMATSSGGIKKCADLSLQIPPIPRGSTSSQSGGEGSIQSSVALKDSSSSVGWLRVFSFKNKTVGSEVERSLLSKSDPEAEPQSPVVSNRIPKRTWKRCTSLQVSRTPLLSPSIATPTSTRTYRENQKSQIRGSKAAVSRSLSMPGRNVIIVRSLSFASRGTYSTDTDGDQITPAPVDEEDQEIPEEDAVCRICYETCEERNTFNMGCSCKGALRLVHVACALKWFNIKGNNFCDVCRREVLNLPVMLLRVQNASQTDEREQDQLDSNSNCQDLVVLFLITSLCYFFFLEQLLISRMKNRAILVSGPFAFTLALSGSILAELQATREYIWTYAALEFLLVALVLHMSYSWLQWGPILAILVSATLGFGIAMLLNNMLTRLVTWRAQVHEDSNPV